MAKDAKAALTPFEHALAGAIGGIASSALCYPLDTIKTKIQADTRVAAKKQLEDAVAEPQVKRDGAPKRLPGPRKPGVRQVARQILKEQGALGYYRGFSASMLNTFTLQFAYFYSASWVRKLYLFKLYPILYKVQTAPKSLHTATELFLGALAGAMAQILTIPVGVVATRQQLDTSHKAQSFVETVMEVLKEDGVTGLWRGLKPSLVLTVNPAITYGMFERLRVIILGEDGKMTPGRAFFIGAMSKTLATIITFPYIMAKVRLQAKYVAEEEEDLKEGAVTIQPKKERYTGAIDVLRKVHSEQGIVGWYQGMQAQIVKAVLAQALLFGLKDALEGYTVRLLAFIASSKRAA